MALEMFDELTKAEDAKLQAEFDKYLQEVQEIADRLKATDPAGQDPEERERLLKRVAEITCEWDKYKVEYYHKVRQKRFKPIREAGRKAILQHAKKWAPVQMERHYNDFARDLQGDEEAAAAGKFGMYDASGFFRINTNYALHLLAIDFQTHAEALDDQEGRQDLLAILLDAVQGFQLTDGEEIAISAGSKSLVPESGMFDAKYLPVFHGKLTDIFSNITREDVAENPIANKATILTEQGYELSVQNFSKITANASINTDKLLQAFIMAFTKNNDQRSQTTNRRASIPLDDYARLCGYEIDERKTETPEAAEKEKRRAAEARKEARKRIKQDLELLKATWITGREIVKVKGTPTEISFESVALFEYCAITRSGYIIVDFGTHVAEALKKLPEGQYHLGLLGIKATKPNAYRIGRKMVAHANMDSNIIRGTASRLKVSTLLAVTSLPTIESLRGEAENNGRKWEIRIKEPFEKALDELTGKVISNWEYVKPKGVKLTDREAYQIRDYETFCEMLVEFELIDAPDHTERLARNEEIKEAEKERRLIATERAKIREKKRQNRGKDK